MKKVFKISLIVVAAIVAVVVFIVARRVISEKNVLDDLGIGANR